MRRTLAVTLIFLMLLAETVYGDATTKDILIEFNGVISFTLNGDGYLETNTNSWISYYPSTGGWFSAEILIPAAELPSEINNENSEDIIQQCIQAMSANFTNISVLRSDYLKTTSTSIFHTQDVSYKQETDYLIYSDGILIWTSKGIVVLWFASMPYNHISDGFIQKVLHSLAINVGTNNAFVPKQVFSEAQILSIVSAEKLHIKHAESNAKYHHLYETPLNKPTQGDSIVISENNLTSKDWMKNKEIRTIFSCYAIIEAINLDYRILDEIAVFDSTYTGRNSNHELTAFIFTGSKVISLKYDENASKVEMTVNENNKQPSSYLEAQKKKNTIVSYYENDQALAREKAEIIIETIKKEINGDNGDSENTPLPPTNTPEEMLKPQPTTPAPSLISSSSVSPAFKAKMDTYEEFFDAYIAYMEKLNKTENPLSLTSDYFDILSKYSQFMIEMDEIDETKLSLADQKYYTEVMLRIMRKLSEVDYD